MPVPVTMQDLATLASSNFPTGTEAIGNSLDNYIRAISAIIRSTYAISSASIASASTTDVSTADGEHVFITGTATINSLGTGYPGCKRELRFNDACTIVNSANILLPDGLNITTATNQTYTFRCLVSGVWMLVASGRDYASLRRTGGTVTGVVTIQNTAIVYSDTVGGTLGRTTLAGSVLYIEAPVSGTVNVRGYSGGGGASFSANGSVTAANGAVASLGSGAILQFDDRSGGNQWAWYSTGGTARLNRAGDGDKVTCDISGNLTAVGNVTGGSDERVKTNWRDLPEDFLEQLTGVKYGVYERTDIGTTQVGVGAQHLRKVLPWAVNEGDGGFLSVAYGNAALVASIATASRLIALEARVASMEAA